MATRIVMPKWGLTMKQGTITKWLKKEGDPVEKGEDLFEVETEKVTNVVESIASGFLFQLVVAAGTAVPVGTILGIIAKPGEQPERIEGLQMGEVVEAEASPAQAGTAAPAVPQEKKFVLATPAARRLAKELGVDLGLVPGTGPKGRVAESDVTRYHEEGPPPPRITSLAEEIARQAGLDISTITGTGEDGKITKEDVENALEAKPAEGEAGSLKSIPFSGMRKAVADNMYASLQNSAQLTLHSQIDVTEMVRFRDQVRKEYERDKAVRISYNDILILAASRVLKRYALMNSTLVDEEILLHDAVNMGVAVSIKGGLIVPVLRDADKKGLLQIAREARELARKAREGTLDVDEVTGGTFTITYLSMFNIDGFTPILKPPETGILGVGKVKEKPAMFKGEICARSMMTLSLTFDHRVIDGAPAAEFLNTLGEYLQHPTLITT